MSRKELIKSRVSVNNFIKNDITQCVGGFLKHRQQESQSPFQQPVPVPVKVSQPTPFKQSLTDWRSFYSEPKFSKSNNKVQAILFGKENRTRGLNSSFSFTKTTVSYNNLKKSNGETGGVSCRKIQSSFSGSRSHRKEEPFDRSITPFVLVQNIYQAKVNNLDETKRAKTARIRQYYERKAQKVEGFQVYDRLEEKIKTVVGEEDTAQDRRDRTMRENRMREDGMVNTQREGRANEQSDIQLVRTGRVMSFLRDRPIYQRKGRRIIMPNEFFKDLKKVKISRKNVIKQYPIQFQHQ